LIEFQPGNFVTACTTNPCSCSNVYVELSERYDAKRKESTFHQEHIWNATAIRRFVCRNDKAAESLVKVGVCFTSNVGIGLCEGNLKICVQWVCYIKVDANQVIHESIKRDVNVDVSNDRVAGNSCNAGGQRNTFKGGLQ